MLSAAEESGINETRDGENHMLSAGATDLTKNPALRASYSVCQKLSACRWLYVSAATYWL